jgi:hypothetical protein
LKNNQNIIGFFAKVLDTFFISMYNANISRDYFKIIQGIKKKNTILQQKIPIKTQVFSRFDREKSQSTIFF